MNTTTAATSPFDRFANRADCLGYCYIGERANALYYAASGEWPADTTEQVAATDAKILEIAAARGWDEERLFAWANSKAGRWFADTALGCRDLARALKEGNL